jgi:heterodisulfide reductase subunit B
VPVVPILGAVLPEEVAAAVVRPLHGLSVACYYGCAFVKPKKITEFDDEENPQSMDRLMVAAGAQAIDWAYKTECCGASLTITRPEVVRQLSGQILAAAKRLGADCVVVACPLCQGNLDQRQGGTAHQYGWDVKIPVIYFTQLLAIAFGHASSELGFGRHLSDPLPLLRAKGFASSIRGR